MKTRKSSMSMKPFCISEKENGWHCQQSNLECPKIKRYKLEVNKAKDRNDRVKKPRTADDQKHLWEKPTNSDITTVPVWRCQNLPFVSRNVDAIP